MPATRVRSAAVRRAGFRIFFGDLAPPWVRFPGRLAPASPPRREGVHHEDGDARVRDPRAPHPRRPGAPPAARDGARRPRAEEPPQLRRRLAQRPRRPRGRARPPRAPSAEGPARGPPPTPAFCGLSQGSAFDVHAASARARSPPRDDPRPSEPRATATETDLAERAEKAAGEDTSAPPPPCARCAELASICASKDAELATLTANLARLSGCLCAVGEAAERQAAHERGGERALASLEKKLDAYREALRRCSAEGRVPAECLLDAASPGCSSSGGDGDGDGDGDGTSVPAGTSAGTPKKHRRGLSGDALGVHKVHGGGFLLEHFRRRRDRREEGDEAESREAIIKTTIGAA